ncbi:MAG TPA: hypothetical protein VFR14_14520, partial [Candidatus Limnocylindrales bacterium]|nr:hypothetical protein [Candidatus Limnocylindrales bacterium]
RLLRRGAGRRLASVTAAAWWVCPACRSLNAPTAAACYACATPWTPSVSVAEAASAGAGSSAGPGASAGPGTMEPPVG